MYSTCQLDCVAIVNNWNINYNSLVELRKSACVVVDSNLQYLFLQSAIFCFCAVWLWFRLIAALGDDDDDDEYASYYLWHHFTWCHAGHGMRQGPHLWQYIYMNMHLQEAPLCFQQPSIQTLSCAGWGPFLDFPVKVQGVHAWWWQ